MSPQGQARGRGNPPPLQDPKVLERGWKQLAGLGATADLLLAPAKVPRNCQIWRSDGEYGRDIAILGNSVAAYSDPVA